MQIDELRIERLKNRTLNCKPSLACDRMRIIDKMHENEEAVQLLRAKRFFKLCEHFPLCIEEDEILVGALGKQINTSQLYAPDSSIQWLQDELSTLDERKQDPFFVSEEEKSYIKEALARWKDKTVSDKITKELFPEARQYLASNVFFIQKEMGYGHCLADYAFILHHGFLGAAKLAQEKYDETDEVEKKQFYESVIITLQGAACFVSRYATYAQELSAKEESMNRKKELMNIGKVCQTLASSHAETFHDALQCIWFIQLLLHLESDGTGVSFGRLDQYLFPFYQNSVKRGESKETLQGILDMFWIKTNHLLKCRNKKAASLWSGYIMNQNITIGGCMKDGRDATNELTLMCLKSQQKLTMKEPQFSLRVHKKTPQEVLVEALRCVRKGGGKPQFVSDKTIRTALENAGIPKENVWDYAIIGCIEPSICGGFNRCKSGHINLGKVLELALYDGYDPLTTTQIGPHTGKFASFSTFAEFYAAFQKQFEHMLSVLTKIHREITHEVLKTDLPHPFLSSLTHGCIEHGRDITNMGANWNWTSFSITGIANLCDSMYAIQQAVYEEHSISAARLLQALKNNFTEDENLRQYLMKLPKYGNGDERVDAMAERVSTSLYQATEKYRGHGDTAIRFGYVTVTKNVSMGKYVGATPDGRKAYAPFADGISPVHECDVCGPLAVLRSSESLHLAQASEGAILNQKYLPSILSSEKAACEFAAMIQVYLSTMNGMHIQFNMVSQETLLEAQKYPEKYKDLLIRVSGYSAYFIELSREVQQDVIERTQF